MARERRQYGSGSVFQRADGKWVGTFDAGYTASYRAQAVVATPTFVQGQAREVASGSANSLAFGAANTAGNLIVAYVIWNNAGAASVSDSRGNAYASAGARTPAAQNTPLVRTVFVLSCALSVTTCGLISTTRVPTSTSTPRRFRSRRARSESDASKPGSTRSANSTS